MTPRDPPAVKIPKMFPREQFENQTFQIFKMSKMSKTPRNRYINDHRGSTLRAPNALEFPPVLPQRPWRSSRGGRAPCATSDNFNPFILKCQKPLCTDWMVFERARERADANFVEMAKTAKIRAPKARWSQNPF